MSDDPTRLELTRVVRAERTRVWRAWTQEWAQWMWPERFGTVVELDARAGAAYRIASESVGMAVSGVVVEAEAPHRLVLTWRWDGESEETLVTVELREVPDGTEIVLRHERHADGSQRDSHAEGWADCLDRLGEHLSAGSASGG